MKLLHVFRVGKFFIEFEEDTKKSIFLKINLEVDGRV
jgi:hypothetical protein